MMKKAILLVVLMVGVLVGGCNGSMKEKVTVVPVSPNQENGTAMQAHDHSGDISGNISDECEHTQERFEGSFLRPDEKIAILFVWDNSASLGKGNEELRYYHDVVFPQFRYLFPRFFARAWYKMSEEYKDLGNAWIAFATMGGVDSKKKLKMEEGFKQVKEWRSSPLIKGDAKAEKGVQYDLLIKDAIHGGDKGWPEGVTRKLVVVLTDGDIRVHSLNSPTTNFFEGWERALCQETGKKENSGEQVAMDVVWVLLPAQQHPITDQSKVYAFNMGIDPHFHKLVLGQSENGKVWAQRTWNMIMQVLFGSSFKSRAQWLSDDTEFEMPENVSENKGVMIIKGLRWDDNNGFSDGKFSVFVGGKLRDLPYESKGSKVEIRRYNDNVGVIWMGYKVGPLVFKVVVLNNKVTNNKEMVFRVIRCNDKKPWQKFLWVDADEGGGGKALQSKNGCKVGDYFCDYVWQHPHFKKQEDKHPVEIQYGSIHDRSYVDVRFSPEIVRVSLKKDKVLVIVVKNVDMYQTKNAKLYLIGNKDADQNCCHDLKSYGCPDNDPINNKAGWGVENIYSDKDEDGFTLLYGKGKILVKPPQTFWDQCVFYDKLQLRVGNLSAIINLKGCTPDIDLYRLSNGKEYGCLSSP